MSSWQPRMGNLDRDLDRDLGRVLQRQFAQPDLRAVLAQVQAAAARLPKQRSVGVGPYWVCGLLLLLGLAGSMSRAEAVDPRVEGPQAGAAVPLSATLSGMAVVGAVAGSAALRAGGSRRRLSGISDALELPAGLPCLMTAPCPELGAGAQALVFDLPRGPVVVLVMPAAEAVRFAGQPGLRRRQLGSLALFQERGPVPDLLSRFALSSR